METTYPGQNAYPAEATYPHTPSVARISPFPEGQGRAVAGATLVYGPVVIRAKLMKKDDGRLFLSMPARKNETNSMWYEMASVQDRTLKDAFERMAIISYEEKMSALALSA